jgi:hypothetical protein
MMSRNKANIIASIISALLALASLILGIVHRLCPGALHHYFGPIVVACWVLLPPVWLWFDWVIYSNKVTDSGERDRIKHLHDLTRNIWLGLIVVLAALFDISVLK